MKDISAKARAQQLAKELGVLMEVKPEEWVNDVREARHRASFL